MSPPCSPGARRNTDRLSRRGRSGSHCLSASTNRARRMRYLRLADGVRGGAEGCGNPCGDQSHGRCCSSGARSGAALAMAGPAQAAKTQVVGPDRLGPPPRPGVGRAVQVYAIDPDTPVRHHRTSHERRRDGRAAGSTYPAPTDHRTATFVAFALADVAEMQSRVRTTYRSTPPGISARARRVAGDADLRRAAAPDRPPRPRSHPRRPSRRRRRRK